MAGTDWHPILRIGVWELWGRTDQFWLMITKDRVVRWEWKRRPHSR